CTHDGIRLEAAGRPTAVVVTTEFLHEAEVQRDALGMHDLIPVVIDHPLSTLTDAEIDGRAQQAAKQAVLIWLGSGLA
ncbi:MAG: UGSC family (seleno)protein, partial [Stellaceae bacterium]